ncbi:putative tetratricopeptide-like helical domain, DYW domain-containing protein [Rosa chinensis]|uniref:Putative tetratricopeptide-like helical domain, DYW domain-containing protein n=1 Tax=Rosa chinensis TaxID=74649 RepID=A0A2P6PVP2_ROSCH|nr:pentatricopeptide repeat-containing protein At3g63370, chloroplastic [Rosa chinensis]PRQ26003.1 putative tetratricopeptide-like helical domain, DYW domain-containing protein [Rosa chinensis]
MATSSPHSYTTPAVQFRPMLNKAQLNPALHFFKFSEKPTKLLPSLKQVCDEGSLREAFTSLGNLLTHQDSLELSLDGAYSPLLELCAKRKALSEGQQIHAHLIKSGAVWDSAFLSTKLVYMYGKCGSVMNAQKVFDKMSHRTIFTWNAMIGACASNGEPLKALEMYCDMRVLGVPLDSFTFPCVLKACVAINSLCCGEEIHGLAIKCGYDDVAFVVNSLVAMYANCNDLGAARKLFDGMKEKEDVVSWNSIISAYSAKGMSVEALGLFREMQQVGLAMNTYTFVAALQACEDSFCGKLGMEIHAAVLKLNYCFDIYVANSLLAMYVRCGKMDEAARIFNDLDDKDIVSWNTLLSGFVQNGLYEEALLLFHDMQRIGHKPDQVSLLNILAASGRLGSLLSGMEAHAYAIKNGFDSDLQVGNTLIDMYAKCCCVNLMGRAFDKMPDKDFISWTTIIAGYAQNNCHIRALKLCQKVQMLGLEVDAMMVESILLACESLKCVSLVKEVHGYAMRRGLFDLVLQNAVVNVYGQCGYIDYAYRMFKLIESKDVVSWTSMISCYVHNGLANEALELCHFMKETNVEPDAIALVSILSAAASLSALMKGKEIHGFLTRKGFILEGSVASSLVDMYARCGNLKNAYNIYNCVRNKSLILWTTMINAYGMHGHGKEAIDFFRRMQNQEIVPDHITFLALLYACSHSGLIDEGKGLFEIMIHEYQLDPWPEHFACMVDLLGRANRLEEAYHFVNSMESQPTAEVWCALLGACRVHSNKGLEEIAAKKILELGTKNPGNYVLVSNIFAARGRWEHVEKVRIKMKVIGLKKNPGCSWIEAGKKVHTFTARDKSHPQSNEIYQKLAQITETLEREAGYVAQTKCVLQNVEEEEKVQMLYGHSERLAIAYGLLKIPEGTPIRITKNLRVCMDCHTFTKLVSKVFRRVLVVRDANRFHHFEDGKCSCGDFW